MKKHTSVLGLIARHSFYKILLVFLLLCGAELFLFYRALARAEETYLAIGSFPRPESLISGSGFGILLAVAFFAIFTLLCLTANEYGVKSGYTVRRLSIDERFFYMWCAIYSFIMLFVLWALETVTVYLMCALYVSAAPMELVSHQTVMLAFYRHELMHALLPLADVGLWVRNALLLFSLSLSAANFSYQSRRGRFGFSSLALALYALALFKSGIGDGFRLFSSVLVFIVIVLETIYCLAKKEEVYQDGEE